LDKFAGGTFETAVGFGIGFALGRALTPVGTKIMQDAYAEHPDKALDAETVAAMHAEAQPSAPDLAGEAAQTGIGTDRVEALVALALTAPGVPELLELLRRKLVSPDDFTHGLRKAKLDARYDAGVTALRDVLLDPAVVAVAIQRGVIPDPGLLPVGPPTEVGNVPPMPVAPIEAVTEVAGSGMTEDRLAVHARIIGLPPAPGELLELLNRGVIVEADYLRGIAEGNTRNEWGRFLMQLRRKLITPHEYAELQLRGWQSEAERNAGAALSGMTADDAQLIYELLGRPIAVHQVTTGLARGGTYDGQPKTVPEPFLKALEESSIRPEWYDLAYANRYTYPSAFVVRALLKDGTIGPAMAEDAFLKEGWPPEWAKQVADHTAATGTGAKSTHVTKAQTQLWTTTHRSYVADESDDAAATAALDAAGVPGDELPAVLDLWRHERELIRRQLSAAQLKKLYHDGKLTRDETVARVVLLGYNEADAGNLVDE
jgi:hypothetical protein